MHRQCFAFDTETSLPVGDCPTGISTDECAAVQLVIDALHEHAVAADARAGVMARFDLTHAEVSRALPAGWRCADAPGGWFAVRAVDGREVHGITGLDVVAAAGAVERREPPPPAAELAATAWWLAVAEGEDLLAAERPVARAA